MFDTLRNFTPDPIAFTLGPVSVRWYGLCIAIGFLVGLFAISKLAKRYEIEPKVIYDVAFYALFFGLIGDRMYYVLYAWEFYRENLWDVFKIWEGGLAIHGGILAGVITVLVFSFVSSAKDSWWKWYSGEGDEKTSSRKKSLLYFFFLCDLLILALFSGLALGRWGNYFNQELFGRPTSLPWGIAIQAQYVPEMYDGSAYFHPTFLYESIVDALIFALILSLHFRRLKKISLAGERIVSILKPQYLGNLMLLGLSLYGAVRFGNEFFRIDYSPLVLGIRWAQIMSVILIFVCSAVWVWKRKN